MAPCDLSLGLKLSNEKFKPFMHLVEQSFVGR